MGGSTWFFMKIDDGDPRLCMKEYSELLKLDQDLKRACGRKAGCVLPDFPALRATPGPVSFTSWIGGCDTAERQNALQVYFDELAVQFDSPADEPVLEQFFSQEANRGIIKSLMIASTGMLAAG